MLATSSGGTLVASANVIHQTLPISWDDPAFQGDAEECASVTLPDGYILWHFVLTQTDATSGLLTVQFDGVAVDYVVLSDKKTGGTLHFNVITTGGGATLTAASTDVTGKLLLLSHICSNVTTTTTTETTTTESTSATATSS
jgi:hypothetical protein